MDHHRLQRRRCIGFGAACFGLGLARAARDVASLPQRNLSVEMRIDDDSSETRRDATASVTIGSTGMQRERGTATVRSSNQQQGLGATQRVLVLNGGRATLRLAQGLQVDDTEVWWTPWGPGVAVRSQWVELVNGMEVQPRWPGGDAPVTLQIAAQSAGRATPQSGQPLPPQASVFTTLQVPMGEWVEVARLQGRESARSGGVGGGGGAGAGFGASTSSRQRSLQVRVSLP